MHPSRPVLGLLLAMALGLSACSDDGEPEDAASGPTTVPPPTTPSATSPSLPPAPPEDALQTAQRLLRDAGTGRWELSVTHANGAPVLNESGYFQVDPPASLSVRRGDAEAPRTLTTISQQTDLWFRAGMDPSVDGCWAHRGLDDQTPASRLVPPAIQVLLARSLVEAGSTDSTIDAAVPLLTAAAPFGETVSLMLLGLDAGYGNVPVRFSMQDGELTGYTVALDDVLRVAQEAGVEPFPGLTELNLVADLRLADVGDPVTLPPPVPDEVVELGPQETVAEGIERCGLV